MELFLLLILIVEKSIEHFKHLISKIKIKIEQINLFRRSTKIVKTKEGIVLPNASK